MPSKSFSAPLPPMGLPVKFSAVLRSRCLTYQFYFFPYLYQNEIILCNWVFLS
ncbi:unnamed protein product [Larinioides sclopetarius]|uniref:Uncharacterized protein n=1 Tax=Larinioides sclopetarius TaxID=280406 RepID=A0AAV2BQ47_9ARAC